jgi:hypothetical protein
MEIGRVTAEDGNDSTYVIRGRFSDLGRVMSDGSVFSRIGDEWFNCGSVDAHGKVRTEKGKVVGIVDAAGAVTTARSRSLFRKKGEGVGSVSRSSPAAAIRAGGAGLLLLIKVLS